MHMLIKPRESPMPQHDGLTSPSKTLRTLQKEQTSNTHPYVHLGSMFATHYQPQFSFLLCSHMIITNSSLLDDHMKDYTKSIRSL
jgi:hypothetical protein